MSDFNDIKDRVSVRDYAEAFLATKGSKYICPSCQSGTGPNGSPAFSIRNDQEWHCFSCGEGGDVFDLAGIVHNLDSKRDQLQYVANWAGVSLTDREAPTPLQVRQEITEPSYANGRAKERVYMDTWRGNLDNPEVAEYLESRGFSIARAKAAGFGYDPARQRLIIPWLGTDYYHIDRDITSKHPHKYEKPKSEDVGPQPPYNPQALDQEVFFITEGIFDALAVMAYGYNAHALNGTGFNSSVAYMKRKGITGTAILLLDNDTPGQDAQAKLQEALRESGIESYPGQLAGTAKDPDEAFRNDPAAFRECLSRNIAEAMKQREERIESEYNNDMKRLMANSPADVAASIYAMEEPADPIPTGLVGLDRALDGGLRPSRLVALGAVSSVGKTTLVVQLADDMAAQGVPVLFVTIEQSAQEIAAKSLCRIMAQEGYTQEGIAGEMVDSRRSKWDQSKQMAFAAACEQYARRTASHLRIMEAEGQPSVADIREAAQVMKRRHGRPPVVIVDYLQLLQAQSEYDTDKQTTDKNVMALRQMARDLKTCVICISSLNRDSYNAPITLSSFKESGAIEYGADILMGLQPYGMSEVCGKNATDHARDLTNEYKNSTRRAAEIVILKNRTGKINTRGIPLTFNAAFSLFTDGLPVTKGPKRV